MDTVEFAAERHKRLVDADREMRLLVVQALQRYVDGDPNWTEPIVTGSAVLWLEIFAREAPAAYPDSVLRDFQDLATRSLKKTVKPDDPPSQAQIDRVTNWIGTLTVNDATFHANRAVRGRTMTWVTMHDEAVRPVHVQTDGQTVSVNGTFDVGGYGLRYPGEPIGPPEIWINCRCLIAGGGVKKAMTASLAVTTEAPPVAEAPVDPSADPATTPVEEPPQPETDKLAWHGVLAPMGIKSGDGRMFADNALTWRNLPLPLSYQMQSSDGHSGSIVVGRIDEVWVEGNLAMARGVFMNTEDAKTVMADISGGFVRGVSVDVDDVALEMTGGDPTGDPSAEVMVFSAARIAGATLVAIPAFQEAFVALGPDFNDLPPVDMPGTPAPVTASLHLVAAGAPTLDGEWFANPGLTGPTPLTVTEDGRIFGHVAAWGFCHIGLPGACTTPPKSHSKYAYYRTGVVSTTTGDVAVGQITMSTGHASIKANARAAADHYDNTGSAVADVAAGEDMYGIWIAGAMRASATPEQREQLRAGSLSGDWRTIGGSLEMVAALAVNVPGFPIPRVSLAASGGSQDSLIASGVIEHQLVASALSAEDVAAIVRTTIDEVAFRAERAGRLASALEAKASIKAKRIGFARARLNNKEE